MASVFSHAVAALGIGACFYRPGVPKRVWVAGAFFSVIPDMDVIGFLFGNDRTERPRYPDALRNARPVKACTDTEGCNRVRENRGHRKISTLDSSTSYTDHRFFG